MSRSINKAILIGHVGKEPEIRYTQGGAPVANFTLATNETWSGQGGEKQERTDWHRIVAWRRLGEFAHEYIRKGSLIYVEGKIRTRSYDDRDGTKRYITEIDAQTIQLLDKKVGGAPGPGGTDPGDMSIDSLPPEPAGTGNDEDVPF